MRSASPSSEHARPERICPGLARPRGGSRAFCTCSAPQPSFKTPEPGALWTTRVGAAGAPPRAAASASLRRATCPDRMEWARAQEGDQAHTVGERKGGAAAAQGRAGPGRAEPRRLPSPERGHRCLQRCHGQRSAGSGPRAHWQQRRHRQSDRKSAAGKGRGQGAGEGIHGTGPQYLGCSDATRAVNVYRLRRRDGRTPVARAYELSVRTREHLVVPALARPLRALAIVPADERAASRSVPHPHNVVELRGREQAERARTRAAELSAACSERSEPFAARPRVPCDEHLLAFTRGIGGGWRRLSHACKYAGVDGCKLVVVGVGELGGIRLPALMQHAAVRIDQLHAVVRLSIVRCGDHEANRVACDPRARGGEHAHAEQRRVEEAGTRAEASNAVAERHARRPRERASRRRDVGQRGDFGEGSHHAVDQLPSSDGRKHDGGRSRGPGVSWRRRPYRCGVRWRCVCSRAPRLALSVHQRPAARPR